MGIYYVTRFYFDWEHDKSNWTAIGHLDPIFGKSQRTIDKGWLRSNFPEIKEIGPNSKVVQFMWTTYHIGEDATVDQIYDIV